MINLNKYLFSVIIFFVIGYAAGNYFNSAPKDISQSPNQETYVSPYDPTKKLIIKANEIPVNQIWLQQADGEPRNIMTILSPRGIFWSNDSSKVTVTDHISNEENVFIIDFDSGQYVQAEGADQFVNSQKIPHDYSHVYTNPVSWYDQQQLIVKVSGYPDYGAFRPKPQYFLIDANSGKVIKQIL